MDEKRILAVSIDNVLFDKLTEYVKSENISKQQYVAETLRNDLAQKLKQKQEIKNPDVTQPKALDKEGVMNAIDSFIIENGRVPGQKEFRNDNGLPSYGAAGRILEMSPAQYANQRLAQINNEEDQSNDFAEQGMSMM